MAFYARAAVLCIHLIKSMKEVVSLRALQQWLDRFCYKHPRLGIPGLMRYIVIGNVLVYLLNLFSTNGYPVASALLSFDTSAILQGQVWRIITFIFVPPAAAIFSSLSSPCTSTTSSALPWSGSGGAISSPSFTSSG